MDLNIRGRVALVGASGGGLGLATAACLAREGCHIAICDLNEKILESAKKHVQAAGGSEVKVSVYTVNLMNADDINRLISSVKNDLGPISILVTNSGGPPPGQFDAADDNKWIRAYELTFLSAVRLIRAVLPDMKSQRWGRIINFTSRSIKEPIPNLIISNSVRLAVVGMAKTLSREVAEYGITVNNVGPGPTTTARAIELAAARAEKKGISVDDELEQTAKEIPIGRLAKPEEQAATVTFLASEIAGYITGVSLLVDGGAVKAI